MLEGMGSRRVFMFDMFKDWFDDLSDMQAFWFIFACIIAGLGFIATLAIVSPIALIAFGIILLIACMAGFIAFGILMMVREDL